MLASTLSVIKYFTSEKFIKPIFIILYFPVIITLFVSEKTASFFMNMKIFRLLGKMVSKLLTHEIEKLQNKANGYPQPIGSVF